MCEIFTGGGGGGGELKKIALETRQTLIFFFTSIL